jgi:hypothetical protein
MHHRTRAADRSAWAVEYSEEAISRDVDLVTPVCSKAAAHGRMVTPEKLPPPSVAQLGRAFGRTD